MERDACDGLMNNLDDDLKWLKAYVASIKVANLLSNLRMIDYHDNSSINTLIWKYLDERNASSKSTEQSQTDTQA